MPSQDNTFQQLSTVQNIAMQQPLTIVAAATIAPLTFLTMLTGTTAVATITPPISGAHMLAIVSATTNFSGFLTTGNILVASITNGTTWLNKVTLLVYNPITAKYYPSFAVRNTTDT